MIQTHYNDSSKSKPKPNPIRIGTLVRYLNMVLGTGSLWRSSSACPAGIATPNSQTDPIFDPYRSRSYATVPYEALLCCRLDVVGCDTSRRSCLYLVSYGDGSITIGEFSMETLTFRGNVRVAWIVLGCGHDNKGIFVATAGMLGLGQGSLSFPS